MAAAAGGYRRRNCSSWRGLGRADEARVTSGCVESQAMEYSMERIIMSIFLLFSVFLLFVSSCSPAVSFVLSGRCNFFLLYRRCI
ncbi:hypothetical protein BRADI_3g06493v3 [Brachypodium distachyon]|uniref:Uncharacterized protein n=1 Tax=Brachypodium distachyon TaxID=15368 RepID=A0A0Q3F2R0_BRADI|nr:hypothetical protein BRADI_3g06493v3 [Brachypodium distachyon]